MTPLRVLRLLFAVLLGNSAAATEPNWYSRSFFLLHIDYHTLGEAEVGRDADPHEIARLVKLVGPDAIQMHAKGNPGWTTYRSEVGHTPEKLSRDVLQLWSDLARDLRVPFSAYFNLGRDREVIRRHPEWCRVGRDGELLDNILCYNSGVAEGYLWPLIDEIMVKYRPAGLWFDGSCGFIENCYCRPCRDRFKRETGLESPRNRTDPAWEPYKEMHRQIYREFCRETIARIKQRDPECLIAINFAFTRGMPEAPPAGIDYLTGDHGSDLDKLEPDAVWYDAQRLPFDLMPATFYRNGGLARVKPSWQLQQEAAIILANGGRMFLWDTPTPEGALIAERYERVAQDLVPFLRSRQGWSVESTRVPDISFYHGEAAQYAATSLSAKPFVRTNPSYEATCAGLRQLHLSYEVVPDWRLAQGNVLGSILLLEDTPAMSPESQDALRRFVEGGGRVLLSGRARASSGLLTEAQLGETDRVTSFRFGAGEVHVVAEPLFPSGTARLQDAKQLLAKLLPISNRHLAVEGGQDVGVLLRRKAGAHVVHLVNHALGERERDDEAGNWINLHVKSLPPAPACRISVKLPTAPQKVTLVPGNTPPAEWNYAEGRLHVSVPSFAVHQLLVIE